MSSESFAGSRLVRFAEFEVDLRAWALSRNGQRVALQRKPFQILRLLLSRPGELVTRAELASELWPDLHVSYDRCLNTAVNALRNALQDPTRKSQFIETRPGLGYRFVGTLTELPEPARINRDAMNDDLAIGYHFLHHCSPAALGRARACFRAILTGAGADAPAAHVGLAETESLSAVCGYAPTVEAANRALGHARSAEGIDPDAPEVRVALAVSSALISGMHDWAIEACASALQRSPQSQTARIWLAEFLCASGQASEAVEHLHIAKRISPASTLIRTKLSLALYLSGNCEAATEHAWAALSVDPAYAAAQHALALAYQQLGYLDDAITEYENAASSGCSAALAGWCLALKAAGRFREVPAAAARLEPARKVTHVSPCWRALVQLACDDRASAQDSLRQAAESGDHLLGFARHDPRFASLL